MAPRVIHRTPSSRSNSANPDLISSNAWNEEHQLEDVAGEADLEALETTVEALENDTFAALALKADKATQVIAGTGLAGGGTLASDQTFNVDPNDATEQTDNDDGADFLLSYDASIPATRKVLPKNLGYTPQWYATPITRPVQGKFGDFKTVFDKLPISIHNAVAAGSNSDDLTTHLQACLDSGEEVFVLKGTYNTTDTLKHKVRGAIFYGAGKRRSVIQNLTTADPLFHFGDTVGDDDALNSCLRDMDFIGNALTTAGLEVLGTVDDGLTQASRQINVSNVRVINVGAGPAARLSAWKGNWNNFEVEDCLQGVKLGKSVYATKFSNYYCVGVTNEALIAESTVGGADSNVIEFISPVFQRGGASGRLVDLSGGASYKFSGVYTEVPHNSATEIFRIADTCANVSVDGMMYSKGSSTAVVDVFTTAAKCVHVRNLLIFGNVRSYAKITGTLPYTEFNGINQPTGAASVGGDGIDDQSTRKFTVVRGSSGSTIGRDGPTLFKALSTQAAWSVVDSSDDTVKMFAKQGVLRLGADDTVPGLTGAGTSVQARDNASLGNFAANIYVVGANTRRVRAGSGSPEGSVSDNPGSIYLNESGGLGSSHFYKESGTGNTGWVGHGSIAGGGTGAATARAALANLSGWYVLGNSAVQVSHTGDTNETTLATITVPAGAMGANGILRVTVIYSYTNSANNKTLRIRLGGLGGTAFLAVVVTTTDTAMIQRLIMNRNAQNSQVAPLVLSATVQSYTGVAAAAPTGSVDTSSAQNLVLTGQLANSGEAVRIEGYIVELFYKA